jgi:hypothetical protein
MQHLVVFKVLLADESHKTGDHTFYLVCLVSSVQAFGCFALDS